MKIVHRRRVTIAGQQVTEQDWRGILAVATTLGYFVVISVATLRYGAEEALAIIGLLSTLEAVVLSWYFKAKEGSK
jgi:hypothetical protein